ncbi:GlxA family transcriptional regulator [Shimia marina]|uniref:Carnitine catabolism transcriptional activator n=1 Tax=Shimia marina TaxID=321267 RepID=A0A0P1FBS1_9RHOB|nr:GlxA family transcriptional regulator [Shimia marina]CUH52981.1 Carnitine catabolism transcriptional activator [Shimia marina]SFD91693.1 DJ-1/PfpI family protein [Shimia marina]
MQDPIIPKGVAHVPVDAVTTPDPIIFALQPNLSMLAFTSAIETLRIANQLTGQNLYSWATMSETGENVRCSNGIEIGIDSPLGETPANAAVFICSGVQPERAASQRMADWIRLQWRVGRRVGGLCTGAYTLAKAGILEGRSFTLHWENIPPFREQFPNLSPLEQLYAIDDRIMTSGGGVAPMDLFLKLIYDRHGAQLARAVLNMCLHTVQRSETDRQQSSTAALIGNRNDKLVRIISYFEENLEETVDLDSVTRDMGVSRRQMERLFKQHLNTTPKRFLQELRLQKARILLAETDMAVVEVATACGYESVGNFSKRFREAYGMSPHRFSAGHG